LKNTLLIACTLAGPIAGSTLTTEENQASTMYSEEELSAIFGPDYAETLSLPLVEEAESTVEKTSDEVEETAENSSSQELSLPLEEAPIADGESTVEETSDEVEGTAENSINSEDFPEDLDFEAVSSVYPDEEAYLEVPYDSVNPYGYNEEAPVAYEEVPYESYDAPVEVPYESYDAPVNVPYESYDAPGAYNQPSYGSQPYETPGAEYLPTETEPYYGYETPTPAPTKRKCKKRKSSPTVPDFGDDSYGTPTPTPTADYFGDGGLYGNSESPYESSFPVYSAASSYSVAALLAVVFAL